MTGWARMKRPAAQGRVRNVTRRRPLPRMSRNLALMPSVATRERTGMVTVATATPKTPRGSCMRRKATLSHEVGPFSIGRWAAKPVFMNTLIWTALPAMTEGTMRVRMRRTPGSRHAKSGRKR